VSIVSYCILCDEERRERTYLNNGWAGGDGVIGSGILAASENNVRLTRKALWHNNGETAGNRSSRNESWASNSNERSIDGSLARSSLESVARGEESDSGTSLDRSRARCKRELRESLEWQGGVGGWAGDDEWRGEGVDLVRGERGVEWLREWGLLERGAEVGAVAGLDGEDGGGGCEVGFAHYVGGLAGVGGDADALEDGGGGDEGGNVGDAKGVCALLGGGDAGSLERVS
jgi:hypothetical protein